MRGGAVDLRTAVFVSFSAAHRPLSQFALPCLGAVSHPFSSRDKFGQGLPEAPYPKRFPVRHTFGWSGQLCPMVLPDERALLKCRRARP